MTDSRLEKFIYAICSLDHSDLPVPLSRIEVLWNCLITGDTPNFTPLSRNEEYLMYILGIHDNLPTPKSRGEELLYKIAIGDTKLDDIGAPLSKYEELLQYIVSQGGLCNTDFEYVTYILTDVNTSLYNTAKKPVKSAILKGQTLKNHINTNDFISTSPLLYTNDISVEKNTIYTCFAVLRSVDKISDTSDNNLVFRVKANDNNGKDFIHHIIKSTDLTTVIHVNTKIEITNEEKLHFRVYNSHPKNMKFMLIKGDYTNQNIPYFEGIQSVKMPVLTTTGKNLLDGKIEIGTINADTGKPTYFTSRARTINFLNIKPNTSYSLKFFNDYFINRIFFYDNQKIYIDNRIIDMGNGIITTPENAKYIKISFGKNSSPDLTDTDLIDIIENFQLEEGDTSTSYESFKSNTLTVNGGVTLRGIGDVRDELNCLTGEVVQRVGEIILNGVENWSADKEFTNTYRFYLKNDDMVNRNWTKVIGNPPFVKSNTFRSLDLRTEAHNLDTEHLTGWDFSRMVLNISKERVSEFSDDALKTYIQKNPITVQYQLATESTKTVDLSVVDQDGNDTKLSTFNDITHVTLSSEGLIPEAELEVAEKVPEVAVSMLTISREQEVIDATTNEQSENVDATMIATTEIYEELL